jgi:hypothetical protein
MSGQICWHYRAEIIADGVVHAIGVCLGLIGAVTIVLIAVKMERTTSRRSWFMSSASSRRWRSRLPQHVAVAAKWVLRRSTTPRSIADRDLHAVLAQMKTFWPAVPHRRLVERCHRHSSARASRRLIACRRSLPALG